MWPRAFSLIVFNWLSMFLKRINLIWFLEKTNCMMTSNRTKINDSDPYVLCWNNVNKEFFAKFNNEGYMFKPVGTNCAALYPEVNEIRHKSKYVWSYFRKQNIFKRNFKILISLFTWEYKSYIFKIYMNSFNGFFTYKFKHNMKFKIYKLKQSLLSNLKFLIEYFNLVKAPFPRSKSDGLL